MTKGIQEDPSQVRNTPEEAFVGGLFQIGLKYLKGQGIYPSAQLDLEGMYQNGIGFPKDYSEALKWYAKAVEQGEAAAKYNLGLMFLDGQ